MVFRGKPSKACERCRARRLKCDLRATCSSCVRANMTCSYRGMPQLRLINESQSVARKASKSMPSCSPQYLPMSIDGLAREAFFSSYVASRCWDFLREYYHPPDSPKHLTLAIDAVGLAYLYHETYSPTALASAREKYVLALRMTKTALKCPEEVTRNTTLLTSLLLDLFEKITDSEPRSRAIWSSDCHVNGALALIRLRGLEQFQDPSEVKILVRLSSHHTVNCIASGSPIPPDLHAIHAYIRENVDVHNSSLSLSDLMIQFADLRSSIFRGTMSPEESIEASISLDSAFETLNLLARPLWSYTTTFLSQHSQRIFGRYFDTYPNHRVCQALNIMRVIRILLKEYVIENYLALFSSTGDQTYLEMISVARENIAVLSSEICASVPQYSDCNGAARQLLPESAMETLNFANPTSNSNPVRNQDPPLNHSHTQDHQLNCYKSIFPLYIVGISKSAPPDVKPWVVKQLRYIGSHFYIRNAEVVARMLEVGEGSDDPWRVFNMLGSYAFGA